MSEESLDFRSKHNFIRQQGFDTPSRQACPLQYSALLFQPKVIAVILALAIVLQSPPVFLALGAVLWWSALLQNLAAGEGGVRNGLAECNS